MVGVLSPAKPKVGLRCQWLLETSCTYSFDKLVCLCLKVRLTKWEWFSAPIALRLSVTNIDLEVCIIFCVSRTLVLNGISVPVIQACGNGIVQHFVCLRLMWLMLLLFCFYFFYCFLCCLFYGLTPEIKMDWQSVTFAFVLFTANRTAMEKGFKGTLLSI